MVHGVVARTPMYEEPILHGDKEIVQRKERANVGNNSLHCPKFVMESKQRKVRGRPQNIRFEGQETIDTIVSLEDFDDNEDATKTLNAQTQHIDQTENVFASDIGRAQWALRRMSTHSQQKCFGMVGRRNCNNILQSCSIGLVAPCFWSKRDYTDKTITQWLWFCNHDVEHTKTIKKQVIKSPPLPTLWPISKGTNVTKEEMTGLLNAGFAIKSSTLPEVTPNTSTSTHMDGGTSTRSKKWRHDISKDACSIEIRGS